MQVEQLEAHTKELEASYAAARDDARVKATQVTTDTQQQKT
jgi:hypothetical protein